MIDAAARPAALATFADGTAEVTDVLRRRAGAVGDAWDAYAAATEPAWRHDFGDLDGRLRAWAATLASLGAWVADVGRAFATAGEAPAAAARPGLPRPVVPVPVAARAPSPSSVSASAAAWPSESPPGWPALDGIADPLLPEPLGPGLGWLPAPAPTSGVVVEPGPGSGPSGRSGPPADERLPTPEAPGLPGDTGVGTPPGAWLGLRLPTPAAPSLGGADGRLVTPPAPDLDAPLVNVVVPPALWDLVTRTPARRRTTPDPPGDRPGRPVPAPTDLPAFPEARRAREKTPMPGGRMRRRWRQPDGTILEWDYLHGAVERYSRRGRHLGEFDPVTGAQTKPADPTRSVEP